MGSHNQPLNPEYNDGKRLFNSFSPSFSDSVQYKESEADDEMDSDDDTNENED